MNFSKKYVKQAILNPMYLLKAMGLNIPSDDAPYISSVYKILKSAFNSIFDYNLNHEFVDDLLSNYEELGFFKLYVGNIFLSF